MYDHFGVMLDCSRNAVMRVAELKKFMDCLQKMGYTPAEIKELDAYANDHGIELIPCVQALGHFTNLVKHPNYADIVDTGEILLAGELAQIEELEEDLLLYGEQKLQMANYRSLVSVSNS